MLKRGRAIDGEPTVVQNQRMKTVAAVLLVCGLAACMSPPIAMNETFALPDNMCRSAALRAPPEKANFSLIYDMQQAGGWRWFSVTVNGERICDMAMRGQRLDLALPDGQNVIRVSAGEKAEQAGFVGTTVTVTKPGRVRYARIQFNELATTPQIGPIVTLE